MTTLSVLQLPLRYAWYHYQWLFSAASCTAYSKARSDCNLHAAAREKIVGWYHTGPRIREADLDVSALLGSYCENPLLVICEVEVRQGSGPAANPAEQ